MFRNHKLPACSLPREGKRWPTGAMMMSWRIGVGQWCSREPFPPKFIRLLLPLSSLSWYHPLFFGFLLIFVGFFLIYLDCFFFIWRSFRYINILIITNDLISISILIYCWQRLSYSRSSLFCYNFAEFTPIIIIKQLIVRKLSSF